MEQLRQAAAAQTAGPSYEEQVALLEKSYELAAKYMPSGGSTGTADSQETESPSSERKAKAVPVGLVSSSGRVVPSSASYRFGTVRETAFRCGYRLPYGCGQCRDTEDEEYHTGLRAWRPDRYQRTKRASQAAGGHACGKICASPQYPADGEGRIQGERLGIEILQVEYDGNVIPVELTVLDSDGQAGIFIPGSTEANAVREVAANMGQNLGTTISITNQSAGDQLLSELGRGAIQGVSQYISKKMREEKVHLKSGYGLMLNQNNNQ